MKWGVVLLVLVSAVLTDVAGSFVLMVLLNGAGERAAGAALRFFAVAMVVAGVAAAAVAGVTTTVHARKQKSRFVQGLWGVGAGWTCLGGLAFVLMLISFGIAS